MSSRLSFRHRACCAAALLAAAAFALAGTGSSDVSVQVSATPYPSAGTPLLVQTQYGNTLPATGEALLEVELSQPFAYLGSSDCPQFVQQQPGHIAAVRSIAHNQVVSCTLQFGIPAGYSGPVAIDASAVALNDPTLGNNTDSASSMVVRLRPNVRTDAYDAAPGDGVCRNHDSETACSLRAAINEANALPGAQVVELPVLATGSYVLTRTGLDNEFSGDLDIKDSLLLLGEPAAGGQRPLVVAVFDSDNADRVLDSNVPGGFVAAVDVQLRGQEFYTMTDGGVVRHRAGQLGLSRCEISHGLAARGGGIHAAAPLTLSQCDVWLNLADGSGGGLYVDLLPGDALRISDTEVTFNRALQPVAHGGGVYVDGGSATIQRSLLAFNEAEDGGGVYALGSSVGIENSTLHANEARDSGGGLFAAFSAVEIAFATIADNAAAPGDDAAGLGGGIYVGPGTTVEVGNSILAGNSAQVRMVDNGEIQLPVPHAGACHGAVASTGFNTVQSVSLDQLCSWMQDGGDALDRHVALRPLANNGGFADTRALPPGSALEIDAAALSCAGLEGPLTSDQRAGSRPADGDGDGVVRCDKGAFELQPAAIFSHGFE